MARFFNCVALTFIILSCISFSFAQEWKPLFDGKTLDGWNIPRGSTGEVRVEDGAISLGTGKEMTGICLADFSPKVDYEIRYEAARISGGDFFATLTFPVQKSYCSFILGGWSGTTIGISCIGGLDASQNETTESYEFQTAKWHQIRVRVTAAQLDVWIKDAENSQTSECHIVNLPLDGCHLSTRMEMKSFTPISFTSWNTTGKIRHVEFRTF